MGPSSTSHNYNCNFIGVLNYTHLFNYIYGYITKYYLLNYNITSFLHSMNYDNIYYIVGTIHHNLL